MTFLLIPLSTQTSFASTNTPTETTEEVLTSTTEINITSGVSLALSYNLTTWVEGSGARPGETEHWEIGVEGSEVELGLSIDKWGIEEDWSETVDLEIGSQSEIDTSIPGISIIMEFYASGDFSSVEGPVDLDKDFLNFKRPSGKTVDLEISNSAEGGDEINLYGKVRPEVDIGIKVDLKLVSEKFTRSVDMPPMKPTLNHRVHLPCKIKKETNPSQGGNVVITPKKEFYSAGEEVMIEAIPEYGWVFNKWSGDVKKRREEITIQMNEDKLVTANFEREKFDLTLDVEGKGTTNPSEGIHSYKYKENIPMTANPKEGWEFVRWSGDINETDKTATITMNEDMAITAIFEEKNKAEPEADNLPWMWISVGIVVAISIILAFIAGKNT